MKEATKKPAAKPTEKAAPKKTATKGGTKSSPSSSTKPKAKPDQQPPSAFSKPLTPSKELAAVVGSEPLARTVVVSKVWEYIKEHKLQNEKNKREILADDKLKAIFGKPSVTMFEMNKHLAAHLKS